MCEKPQKSLIILRRAGVSSANLTLELFYWTDPAFTPSG